MKAASLAESKRRRRAQQFRMAGSILLLSSSYELARVHVLHQLSGWVFLAVSAVFAAAVAGWQVWNWIGFGEGKLTAEFRSLVQFSVDHAAFSIMWLDSGGHILYTNEAASELLGYSPEEFRSMRILDVDPDYSEEMYVETWNCTKEAGAVVFDSRHRKKNGQIVPVEISARLIEFNGKEISCCFCSDITERKATERALRIAHDQWELFFNAVPSILIALDHTGRVERWNLAATNTFGLADWLVRGRPLGTCGVAWVPANLEATVDSWLRLDRQLRYDELQFMRETEKRFLGLTINPVVRENGENAGVLIAGVDNTDRRHLEDELRQAQKLEAVGQLASGIAHEINTPTQYVSDNTTFFKESWAAISNILVLTQSLQQPSYPGVAETTLRRLAQCAQAADLDFLLREVPVALGQSLDGLHRIAQIVRAMKEFSHPGSAEKSPTDINRAIETTVTVARNEWKYVADVVTDFDRDLPLVPCFVGEFNQAMLNLIVNAAHAIREAGGEQTKGTITIATRRHGNFAKVIVKDTGAGIPESIRSRIFEPFFTTKPVGKGTGQGLALAHSVIVKKHDGSIRFETEMGKGTTFFIRLPLAESAAAEAAVGKT